MTLLKTTIACLNFPLTLLGGSFTAWSISSLPGLDSTNQYILLVFVCGKTTEYNRVKLETGYPDILPPTYLLDCGSCFTKKQKIHSCNIVSKGYKTKYKFKRY